MDYTKHFNTVLTPQTEPMRGTKTPQVQNSAGGFSWTVNDWVRLDRFLILGSEKGTYYASENKLTIQNAEAALRCIQESGPRVVNRVVEISEAGRAPKNDPALFVLAMCMKMGNEETKRDAYAALPRVARIGTHLFHLAQFIKGFGKISGSGIMRAFARWYTNKDPKDLAYQLAKYQSRDGWSHHDLLRLAHPVPQGLAQSSLFRWVREGVVNSEAIGWAEKNKRPDYIDALNFLRAVSDLRTWDTKDIKGICDVITTYKVPMECVPNEVKDRPEVWEALLSHMGLTAIIRNLGKMTEVGILTAASSSTKFVVKLLKDEGKLRKARIHPIQVLLALKTYEQGRGFKGSLSWDPVRKIVDALDSCFYLSFDNVEPTGKRVCYALDVSSSMDGNKIAGTSLTAREGAAAMAMVCSSVEEDYEMMAFSTEFIPLTISSRQRMDDVIRTMSNLPFGGTDCSIPMRWALQRKKEFDAFVVITDSETWAGDGHPVQWLKRYREQKSIPAKLIVMGMCSNEFSIADPDDAGMLDCCGFDASTPTIVSDFIEGR
jgi:60 kDa SS-A/Ro ribonucleoprotein